MRSPWARIELRRSIGTISVLLAASLFATSGTIIKHLIQAYRLQPLTVAAARMTLAALMLFAVLGVSSV